MGFFSFIGLLAVVYYVIQLILWIVLDSDIELWIKEQFGQPISSLRGKIVWVTGASSGIGKNLAITLAKNGVKLVLSARREDELEKVKQECLDLSSKLLSNDDILVLKMDMLDISKHQEHFDTVINHFNGLDILVNNAGRSQRAPWADVQLTVDRELFELDVFSVINLCRIAVKYFERINKRGHLAVTSSGAGIVGVPYSPSYCGAKHALHGYFSALLIEKAIDVTIYCPGPIATDFLQECFTSTVGEKFGEPVRSTDKRMTGERCGFLFAVALANKIYLSWVGLFPISALLYLTSYYPNITKILQPILNVTQMKKIREGR